ncbi:hypothetical protein V6N11_030384 [Hibiscus sabdariffa]|uniref:Uncharacterized protein n=1 Tax=Hibiscus sabdariffa TaxID=183260 RepID=A0ABR2PKS7_9ROSI
MGRQKGMLWFCLKANCIIGWWEWDDHILSRLHSGEGFYRNKPKLGGCADSLSVAQYFLVPSAYGTFLFTFGGFKSAIMPLFLHLTCMTIDISHQDLNLLDNGTSDFLPSFVQALLISPTRQANANASRRSYSI